MYIADIYNPRLMIGYSAEERIISAGLSPLYEELRRIIFDTEVIISKKITTSKKAGAKGVTGAPGLADGLNKGLGIGLTSIGWSPLPAPGGEKRNIIDWFKSVKPKTPYAPEPGLGLEIQFGNNYQFHEDINRLTEAHISGKILAGIIVVASDILAKHKADRGCSFSNAKSKLERHLKTLYGQGAMNLPPLMIIAIQQDGYNEKENGEWTISPITLQRNEDILISKKENSFSNSS